MRTRHSAVHALRLTTPINARINRGFLDYATSCIVPAPSTGPGWSAASLPGSKGLRARADGGLQCGGGGTRRAGGMARRPLHGDRVSPELESTSPCPARSNRSDSGSKSSRTLPPFIRGSQSRSDPGHSSSIIFVNHFRRLGPANAARGQSDGLHNHSRETEIDRLSFRQPTPMYDARNGDPR